MAIWNEKLITEQLSSIFKVAGNPCIPLYGKEPNLIELKKRLKDNGITTYIHYTDKIQDQLPIITDGYWRSGQVYIETYDLDEKKCILKMIEFIKMGCEQKYNSISVKRSGPFDVGGINFLRWWPLDLNVRADNLDIHYMAANLIDIQFNLN